MYVNTYIWIDETIALAMGMLRFDFLFLTFMPFIRYTILMISGLNITKASKEYPRRIVVPKSELIIMY
mgnify:CR=1 FL=1